jgi:protein-tyrosine phosphatase
MFATTVMGLPEAALPQAHNLRGPDVRRHVDRLQQRIEELAGRPVPADPREQLRQAVEAVFRSCDSSRAQAYREREGIDGALGTAVNVQAMVFGHRGTASGTGVVFTRDPATGAPGPYGDHRPRAQGEDVVTIDGSTGCVWLGRVRAGRVTAAPRTAGRLIDSHLPLPGTTNVRDLAGYPASPGHLIGARRLLRGEVLAHPGGGEHQGVYDEVHAQSLRDLGLRAVLDLRAEGEVLRTPSVWRQATGAQVVQLPIAEGGEGAHTGLVRMLLSGELARFDVRHMTAFYRETLATSAPTFAAAARVLADPARLPALVHCSAGKDRRGLLIALVLDVLGTPREVVIEDYTLTGVLRPDRVATFASTFTDAGVDPEVARVLFETPAESMRQVLAELDETFGGAGGYLVAVGGLEEEVLDSLRCSLLVPRPHRVGGPRRTAESGSWRSPDGRNTRPGRTAHCRSSSSCGRTCGRSRCRSRTVRCATCPSTSSPSRAAWG